ncbi:MAG TPA: undecaprenyl/decaprenyl-phosphate alpha-N-acetylglucosaminyl 1-phosphate transferase, partial [Bacillales bacterium]
MHSFETYTSAFGIALIVTILSMPVIKAIALQFRIVDTPDARKIHNTKMPRLGGLSIVIGFMSGFLYLLPQ